MRKMYSLFDSCRGMVPPAIRSRMRQYFSLQEYDAFLWRKQNPYIEEEPFYHVQNSPFLAGILIDKMQYHHHWIKACRDLDISYQLIDLASQSWIEKITDSGCDVFLVWPDVSSVERKTMFDERLNIMVNYMGLQIYPSLLETWLYENKRVQNYWMQVNQVPCLKTWVFYEPKETLRFVNNCSYPVMFKTNLGAASSGVSIIDNVFSARKMVSQAFKRGSRLKRDSTYNRQKGNVYFQEYIPNVKEWRMVRIGDSYFGHGKESAGGFHSGSGKVNWHVPPGKVFGLLKDVTDLGEFTSMDVDVFETESGNLFVNELQTVFGTSIVVEQMKIDDHPGRYRFINGVWQFEQGDFCANHMCNLRIEYLLGKLSRT